MLLQAVAKHLRGTIMKSSAVISNLVGPAQQMSLVYHPVKGLYFTLAGGPEVCICTLHYKKKNYLICYPNLL